MSIHLNEAFEYFKRMNLDKYDLNITEFRRYMRDFFNITRTHKIFDFETVQHTNLAEVFQDSIMALTRGLVRAPFPRCVYNFTIENGLNKHDLILILSQTKDYIEISGFIHCPDGWKPPLIAYRFYFNDGVSTKNTGGHFMSYVNQSVQDKIALEGVEEGERFLWYAGIALTYLMNNTGVTNEHVEIDKVRNRKLIARNKTPIPAYNIVRISPSAYAKKKGSGSSGLTMRRHERRGHLRRLRAPDGTIVKIVNVQPTTVHPDHPDPLPQGHYVVPMPPSGGGLAGPL